jgi:FkbM family methyltransferase
MMTTVPAAADLVREYERVALAAGAGDAGRMTTLGWDLEYTAPDSVLAFIDQILFRRLNDFLPEQDAPVILDCGANIGYTVLHYKRQFPRARVIAFEPDPQFAPILRRNLARNGAADVDVVEAAAWTTDGRARWAMEGKDGSRIVTGDVTGDVAAPVVDVATVDLARYLDTDIDLLKLDIEGAEFDVVPHIAPLLGRVKNILVECHLIDQSKYNALGPLLTTLTAAGFNVSLNSYGPWRDLTRRHVPGPLHAEQYMLVAGWRTDAAAVSRDQTYAPYLGIQQETEYLRRLEPVAAHADHVARVLGGLATDAGRWTTHEMQRPFRPADGRCWRWPAHVLPAGDAAGGSRSLTIVLEDGRVLGPGHALHDDIRAHGGGRFSHYESQLYFSTSDHSDPNSNGRRYTVLYPR